MNIKELIGKTILSIHGLDKDSDVVTIHTDDGKLYQMYHPQDCCESVSIESVCGDVDDLLGSLVITAEERTSGENPEGVKIDYQGSFTWTFYELATNKGSVTIRWYGESNGYYSESVSFEEVSTIN